MLEKKPLKISTSDNICSESPKSKTLSGTLLFKKDNVDAARKYNLKVDELINFQWLKSQNIDSDDDTLSYWSKKHLLSRLQEVHRYAIKYSTKSIGAYMQNLLKEEIKVPTDRMLENQTFAIDFKNSNKWIDLKIEKNYITCEINGSGKEIYLDIDQINFIKSLCELHKFYYENKK